MRVDPTLKPAWRHFHLERVGLLWTMITTKPLTGPTCEACKRSKKNSPKILKPQPMRLDPQGTRTQVQVGASWTSAVLTLRTRVCSIAQGGGSQSHLYVGLIETVSRCICKKSFLCLCLIEEQDSKINGCWVWKLVNAKFKFNYDKNLNVKK